MEAYLDNAATTRCREEVKEIVVKTMMEDFGNPSAMHIKGVEAERYVKEAKEAIAGTLKVKPKEIFFTSGGTESDNWALIGCAMANRRQGNHIIISAIEHAAVAVPAAYLEEQGFFVTRLGTDSQGRISLRELAEAITPETILVSVMYVNNEIGSVQPMGEIGALIKQKNPKTLFHVDAIQAFGKYRIYPKREKIDLLSVSGHKIHGPKGTGFLYIQENTKISPLIRGGGQQNGMRSGTDNVPGIAGLGRAAKLAYAEFDKNIAHMREIKQQLLAGLGEIENVTINGMPSEEGAPQIVNASFAGVRSEVLLHTLEERKIYVSAGSACSSHKRSGSATLNAIGLPADKKESAIRFSFCADTAPGEITYTLEVLKEVLPALRRYTRR